MGSSVGLEGAKVGDTVGPEGAKEGNKEGAAKAQDGCEEGRLLGETTILVGLTLGLMEGFLLIVFFKGKVTKYPPT